MQKDQLAMIAMILNGKTYFFSFLTVLGCHATSF
jgi:hypothetical protein